MYKHGTGKTRYKRTGRKVVLRNEKRKDGSWLNLEAYLDSKGCLHIDGHDLGPITQMVSGDGEYEYFLTIAPKDLPRLVKLLGGKPGTDILELLEQKWTAKKSFKLEEILEKSKIPVVLDIWSG